MLLLTLTASALVALLVSSRLQRLVSVPVLEMAATARRISDQRDYKLRAPKRTEDEIGVAVEAFNRMLDRIEDADGRSARPVSATASRRRCYSRSWTVWERGW